MTRISKAAFLSLAIQAVSFSTDAVAARNQTPTDQLSQALQQAGLNVGSKVLYFLGDTTILLFPSIV